MNYLFNSRHKIIEFNQNYCSGDVIMTCSNPLILRMCELENSGKLFDTQIAAFAGSKHYILICAN